MEKQEETMKAVLQEHFNAELSKAKTAVASQDFETAWLGIGWTFFPAIILLAMPWLLGMVSDRVFGYDKLFRSMLDVMLWLSLCAGFGLINGTIRLFYWVKDTKPFR